MCVREVRQDRDGLLVLLDRRGRVAGLLQKPSEIEASLREIGPELKGRLEVGLRPGGIAHALDPVGLAGAVMRGRLVRAEPNRFQIMLSRLQDPLLLERVLGQILVRDPAVGILSESIRPKGIQVLVDRDLPPRRHAERHKQRGSDECRDPWPISADRVEGKLPDRRDQRQGPDAGEILEVIGHERETHRINVDEPESRRQRADEEEHRDERPLADAAPEEERRDQCDQHRRRIGPGGQGSRIDRPARIDERQPDRPEDLAEIEADGPPRDQDPVDRRQLEIESLGADVMLFHPDRDAGESRSDDEHRHERPNVVPGERRPFPPIDEQESRRQRTGHRLAQKRQNKKPERCRVPEPVRRRAVRWAKAEIGEGRCQVQEPREDILPLRDPGDRFDMHRMQHEQRGREPRRRNGQSQEDPPEEDAAGRVEHQVDRVIAGRVQGVKSAFDLAERGSEDERIILRRRGRLDPDANEPARPAVTTGVALRST